MQNWAVPDSLEEISSLIYLINFLFIIVFASIAVKQNRLLILNAFFILVSFFYGVYYLFCQSCTFLFPAFIWNVPMWMVIRGIFATFTILTGFLYVFGKHRISILLFDIGVIIIYADIIYCRIWGEYSGP